MEDELKFPQMDDDLKILKIFKYMLRMGGWIGELKNQRIKPGYSWFSGAELGNMLTLINPGMNSQVLSDHLSI